MNFQDWMRGQTRIVSNHIDTLIFCDHEWIWRSELPGLKICQRCRKVDNQGKHSQSDIDKVLDHMFPNEVFKEES